MAKRKSTSRTLADRLPNRKYVTVTWAAASTTWVGTEVDTMMGVRDKMGWLISRVEVGFKGAAATPPAAHVIVADSMPRFQIATGEQTGLLAADDDSVVCTMDLMIAQDTTGAAMQQFPLQWFGPIMIASRKLTCMMDAADNVAPWQSRDMLFTIWYQWSPLSTRDYLDIAEGKGIL